MDEQTQRIAIAEACGWKECERCTRQLKPKSDGVEIRGLDPNGDHTGGWKEYALLPDYLNDLNAMHEAEKVYWDNQVFRQLYRGYLLGLTNDRLDQAYDPTGEEWSNTIHATATHRAEAFLRTLGLWKDDASHLSMVDSRTASINKKE